MDRNPAFDLMKGIAVLLMVYEHYTIHPLPYEHEFVYSFHMPLFFLIGGYFAKDVFSFDGFWLTTKNNATRLLLPCVATLVLLIGWGLLQSVLKQNLNYVARWIYTLFWFSGDSCDGAGQIAVGPIWFLIALFWLREIFVCIQVLGRKISDRYTAWIVLGVCIILSVMACLFYPIVAPLPLGILPGIGGLIFYAIGWIVRKHRIPWYATAICVLCWPLSILYGGIEMYSCSFSFPLDILGACGATYLIYKLCNALIIVKKRMPLCKHGAMSPIQWCGVYSLPILCMHTFEKLSGMIFSFLCRFPIDVSADILIVFRCAISVLLAIIVIRIPFVKHFFGVK